MLNESLAAWEAFRSDQKSRQPIYVRIDRTLTGRKYGKNKKYLYDSGSKSYIGSQMVEVLMVSIGSEDYIVDFLILREGFYGTDVSIRMLKKLLLRLDGQEVFLSNARVVLDGWYGKGSYIEELCELGFKNIVVKSGGVNKVMYCGKRYNLKTLKTELCLNGTFKKFNKCHGLEKCQYIEGQILLSNSNTVLKFVLLKYSGGRHPRYLMLLTPNLMLHAFMVTQYYMGRWAIEVMFRTVKQYCGFSKCRYHSEKTYVQETYLTSCFICYMILNQLRVLSNNKMSIKELCIHITVFFFLTKTQHRTYLWRLHKRKTTTPSYFYDCPNA